jgi:hypothetical protein
MLRFPRIISALAITSLRASSVKSFLKNNSLDVLGLV